MKKIIYSGLIEIEEIKISESEKIFIAQKINEIINQKREGGTR